MSPLTKCDTIAPNLAIQEIRFRHIDPDVHADLWYKTVEKCMNYERLKMKD